MEISKEVLEYFEARGDGVRKAVADTLRECSCNLTSESEKTTDEYPKPNCVLT
jgi:hypothetical protein